MIPRKKLLRLRIEELERAHKDARKTARAWILRMLTGASPVATSRHTARCWVETARTHRKNIKEARRALEALR